MLDRIVRLLQKTSNIERSTYIWNAVSATLLAIQAPVILAVMTRTNGDIDAGIFSIAIAIANLMMYVGQYGIRRFQASDVREQFSFEEYHGMRIITCIALIVMSLLYCAYGWLEKGYSNTKFAAIFMVCMLKMIQAYSDVFHGNMQQKGRFDVAAKATSARYAAEIAIFCAALILTRHLFWSALICVAASAVLMFILSVNTGRHYCDSMKPSFRVPAIKELFIAGFPLFISMFLNTYVGNAPKYAIDTYLNDSMQAVFGFIFMPAFVVQIAAQFIFNPVITSYAHMWSAHSEESFKAFNKRITKMCAVIFGLTVLGLVVAATIGIPVLSFIFAVDLSPYKTDLCIIMLGGGLLAYATYFSTVIAIIRAQRSLIICYGIVSIMALTLSGIFVDGRGIRGATCMYVLLMGVLAISLLAAMYANIRREKIKAE
ncbi:MAG: lipopolysaccharide biosynthesis protein [Mogibacterium sp.]|nr:lipopolysaccharide biosynthesis protein [Mogibacterium sp.]